MEDGFDRPNDVSENVETPDGQRVFLFRYENPDSENKNPNSQVSNPNILGTWFTDSLSSLKDYINKKKPGGQIKIVEIPKEKLEGLKAINHPIAKTMDIEPHDNYIVPLDLQGGSQVVELGVEASSPNKFLFGDRNKVSKAIDELVLKLKDPAKVS